MLTERILSAPLAGARATVAPYPKGRVVMERLLEFLDDEAR
jgi:hypothetical protein